MKSPVGLHFWEHEQDVLFSQNAMFLTKIFIPVRVRYKAGSPCTNLEHNSLIIYRLSVRMAKRRDERRLFNHSSWERASEKGIFVLKTDSLAFVPAQYTENVFHHSLKDSHKGWICHINLHIPHGRLLVNNTGNGAFIKLLKRKKWLQALPLSLQFALVSNYHISESQSEEMLRFSANEHTVCFNITYTAPSQALS